MCVVVIVLCVCVCMNLSVEMFYGVCVEGKFVECLVFDVFVMCM